jgi:gentisate 1,2-dioxygenase
MTVTEPALPVGVAVEDWTGDARFHEYTRAANPVGRSTPLIPVEAFPAALHRDAPTGVVPLDLSGPLGIEGYPATSPALLASFVTVRAGESLVTEPRATSELYVVMRGAGATELDGDGDAAVAWAEGDVFALPGGHRATHRATADATLYWVTDEPLLRYLGVAPVERRLRPTLWPAARNAEELAKVAADPAAERRNRVSILLANADQDQTLTATHVLWAMVGLLPVDAVQKPHRHQSVALDLILDCRPGCYTLVGPRLADDGSIVEARRVDWEPGGAFVTPPGWWHAHHNESGAEAHLLPVQDAGLHTHLRTLDIRFGERPRDRS